MSERVGDRVAAAGRGGVLVGPPLGRQRDRGRDAAQQRVRRRGQLGNGLVQVVTVVQVGAFVGEDGPALAAVQAAQQSSGHDDAPGSAGDGVGLPARVVDDG